MLNSTHCVQLVVRFRKRDIVKHHIPQQGGFVDRLERAVDVMFGTRQLQMPRIAQENRVAHLAVRLVARRPIGGKERRRLFDCSAAVVGRLTIHANVTALRHCEREIRQCPVFESAVFRVEIFERHEATVATDGQRQVARVFVDVTPGGYDEEEESVGYCHKHRYTQQNLQ